MEERLHKVLAARGVASRRAAEILIQEGRVSVNGRAVLELGTKVDPNRAIIKVDGRLLSRPRLVYLLLNKPRGYLTTASDPEGRRTVFDLLDIRERVFPVGRLDMDSEGLLLLTNDGELANRIAHPRYRIDKEYHALVAGTPPPNLLDYLRRGGQLVEGRRTSPAEVSVLEREAGGTWIRIVIHEGRKRQVRQLFEEIGHPVRRLRRIRLGPLTLAGLPAASYRHLAPEELTRLRRQVGLPAGDEASGNSAAPGPPSTGGTTARRAATHMLGAGRPRGKQGRPGSEPARTTGRAAGRAAPRAHKPHRQGEEHRGGEGNAGGNEQRGRGRADGSPRPGGTPRPRRPAPHHRD